MTRVQPTAAARPAPRKERRRGTTLAAFVLGMPLAVAILCFIHFGPPRETVAVRYVKHPAEQIEVVMFCMALGALAAKLMAFRAERRACRMAIVPPWDGRAVPVAEAGKLLASLQRLSRRLQETLIVRRVRATLDFLCSRGSAAELDDQLRALADTDAVALEGSYGLIRFITWAVPILGFLGTVLGITTAISGVSPEVLEKSLSTVTDGLAEAFDTTALALALTMLTMFLSFLVERAEQSIHDQVDRYVDRELAHRFERAASEEGKYVDGLRRHAEVLLQAVDGLVQRQAKLWAQTIEEADRRRNDAEKRQQVLITEALEKALEHTIEAHDRRLAAQEKQVADHHAALLGQLQALAKSVGDTGNEQQASLAQVAAGIAAQVQALGQLQDSDKYLRRLQETLNQNLAALAGAGTFEQAIHSLTAAIHLMTARTATTPAGAASRIGPRPGAAA